LGLTSTDTARVLAELVTAGLSEGRFETTMIALESALRLAVLRRETRALSDITQTLVVAAKDPSLTVQQRMRVDAVVGRLAEPGEIRSIVDTMRLAPPNSKERQGARDVLDALGERAIAPLIEQLAAEPEMSARKALIELLSTMAPRYIAEVGGYVSDGRWYVVRNVVTILGSAKSSAVIPYLERALRHPEERVRRESIRALSGLSDGAAQRGLMSALSDEDAQNVRLAARYLGAGKVVAAVPALEQVARGEGIGSRELGPRVEAIDALGRIGAVTALPTLDALAARRLLQGGRPKELRIAAATAVAKIKGFGGPV
jgi:HEAT repeat protein